MISRKLFWTTFGLVAGAVVLSLSAQQRPQGPPQGGAPSGPPQGMMRMFNPRDMVERTVFGSWGVVSLEFTVNDDTLQKIRSIYREEWTKIKASLANVNMEDQTQRQQALQTAMEGVRTLREKIRPLLSEEQNKELDEWTQRQMMRGPGGPGGAAGQGDRGSRRPQQ